MESSIEYLRSVLPRTAALQFATLQEDFERLRDVGEISMRLVVQPAWIRGDGQQSNQHVCDELWVGLGGGITSLATFEAVIGHPVFIAAVYIWIENTRTQMEMDDLLKESDRHVTVKSENHTVVNCFPEVSFYRPPADDAREFAAIAGDECQGLCLSSLDIGPTEMMTGLARWLGVLHLLQSFGLIQGIGESHTIDDYQVNRMIVASGEVATGKMDSDGHELTMQSIRRSGFTYFTVKRFLRSSALAAGVLHDIVTGKLSEAAKPSTDRPLLPNVGFSKTQRRVAEECWDLADWSKIPVEANASNVALAVWNDEEKESTALRPMLSAINRRCLEHKPPILLTLGTKGDFIVIDYTPPK